MTCLSEQSYVLVALEQCKFHNVPGWARNVLVVWPHNPELVNVLLSYDCIVTIVVADMQEYQKLTTATEWAAWLQSRRIRVVHCNPDSYIAAVPLQHFVAVFLHSSA